MKRVPPLREQWLGGSLRRPSIVKVTGLPHGRRWWESCPEHGGTPHRTWEQARQAMEAHLGSYMHPAAGPEPIATVLPRTLRTLGQIHADRAARATERTAS